MKLIMTPDYPNDFQYTFLVYDLHSKSCIFKKEKINSLDSIHLINQGRNTFRPFGIYHWGNKIIIVSNDKIAVFDDCNFEYKENLNISLFINTHQILVQDDILYTCNTSNDTIGIYELNHKKEYFLNVKNYTVSNKISIPNDAYNLDTHHVNSLFYQDNKLFFCLHNKNKDLSEFAYLDLKDRKIVKIAKMGICCHNIEVVNNILYSLSTKTGQLLICDLSNLHVRYVNLVDSNIVFLRGMKFYNNSLLIGVSNRHDIDYLSKNNCYILKYDIENSKISNFLQINDAYIINDFILI